MRVIVATSAAMLLLSCQATTINDRAAGREVDARALTTAASNVKDWLTTGRTYDE